MPELILSSNPKCVVTRINDASSSSSSYITKRYFKNSFRAQIFRQQRLNPSSRLKEIDLISTELEILRNLNHVNLIHLLSLTETNTSIELVLEDGGITLTQVLKCTVYLPMSRLNKYMSQLFDSVRYLHENRVIHGDLKPDNVLINECDVLKLCDFGSSLKFDSRANDIIDKVPLMTPMFTSPEACVRSLMTKKGEDCEEIHAMKLDMWALGIIIHLILFKRYPFEYEEHMSAIQLYEVISSHEPNVPKGVSIYGDLLNGTLKRSAITRWSIWDVCAYWDSVYR